MSARRGGVALVAALFVAITGLPVLRLVVAAFANGPSGFATSLAGVPGVAIWNTLWVAVVVTAISVALGTALAMATERAGLPGRRWLRIAILLPLLTPPFVSAQAFAAAYGPGGLVDQVFHAGIPAVYGPFGVVTVLVISSVPLVYLVVASALASRGERAQELAARASGASAWFVARAITLPLLRPALAAAGVLVVLSAVNAFGVPAILGVPGGFTTVTTRLYSDLAFSSDPAAFDRVVALAGALAGVAVVVIIAADALVPGRVAVRTGEAGSADAGVARGPLAVGAAAAVGVALALLVGVPLVALLLAALDRAAGLPAVPTNWTLDNFRAALAGPAVPALGTSVLLACIAATVVLLLGAAAAFVARGRAGRAAGSLVAAGYVVPGSALAVAVILAYGGALRDTLAIILVAYLAKFWAIGQRSVAASLDRIPPDLGRAVRASGGDSWSVARTVLAPALSPAAAAAWLLVFVLALHELTMSSLLYGPGTATLAVVVLNLQQLGDPGVSSALAVLLTLLVLIATAPFLLAGRAGERLVSIR